MCITLTWATSWLIFFCRFCPWALQLILLSRINLFSAHSFLDICSYRQEVKLDLQLVKSALFIRMLTSWKAVQWYFSWLSMMFSKYRIDGMFSIYRIEGTTHIACHMGSYVIFSAHVTTLIFSTWWHEISVDCRWCLLYGTTQLTLPATLAVILSAHVTTLIISTAHDLPSLAKEFSIKDSRASTCFLLLMPYQESRSWFPYHS